MNANEIYDEFTAKLIEAFLDDSAWIRLINQVKDARKKEQTKIEQIEIDNERANAMYEYLRKAQEK